MHAQQRDGPRSRRRVRELRRGQDAGDAAGLARALGDRLSDQLGCRQIRGALRQLALEIRLERRGRDQCVTALVVDDLRERLEGLGRFTRFTREAAQWLMHVRKWCRAHLMFPQLLQIGTLSIPVLRKGGSTGSISVQYATTNGTAAAPADFTAATLTAAAAATLCPRAANTR